MSSFHRNSRINLSTKFFVIYLGHLYSFETAYEAMEFQDDCQ